MDLTDQKYAFKVEGIIVAEVTWRYPKTTIGEAETTVVQFQQRLTVAYYSC